MLRAFYDWMVDSGLTPYLLVDAASEAAVLPSTHVADGRILLNIGPEAVRRLCLDNDAVRFDGRFSGRVFAVTAPIEAVLALYAKETGEGVMFEAGQLLPLVRQASAPSAPAAAAPAKPAKPQLKLVT